MSFFFRAGDEDHDDHDHEFKGHRACDWRVGIDHACPDPEFFDVVYVVFLAGTVVTLVVQFFVLAFRVFLLKDRFSTFKQGENATLLLLILSQIFNLIISASLVAHVQNRAALEVFWTLYQNIFFGPVFVNLHAIIGATPGLKFTEFKVPAIILNQQVRFVFLTGYFFFFTSTFTILLALANHFEALDEHDTAHALWQAGFVIQTVIVEINAVALIFFTYHFKKAANGRLRSIKADLKEEKEEYDVLKLTLAKSNKVYSDLVMMGPLAALIYLALAFYEDFFANLVFAKVTCALLYGFLSFPTLFFMLGAFYVDVRKYKVLKSRTHSGGSSSNRADMKMEQSREDTATVTTPDPIQEFLERDGEK